jgi:hypothetical protein
MYSGYIGKIGYALRDLPKGLTVGSAVRVGDRVFQARSIEHIWKNMEVKVVDADGPTLIVSRAYIEQDIMRDQWLYDGSYTERWEQGFRRKLYHGRTGPYFESEIAAHIPFDKWTVPEIIEGDNPLEDAPFNNAVRMRNSIDGVTPTRLYFATPKAHERMIVTFQAKLPSTPHQYSFEGVVAEVNSSGYSLIAGLVWKNGVYYLLSQFVGENEITKQVTIRHPDKYARYTLVFDPPWLKLYQAPVGNPAGTPLELTDVLQMGNIRGKAIIAFFNETTAAVTEWRLGNFWIFEISPAFYDFLTLFKGTVTSSGQTSDFDTGYFKQAEVCVDVTGVSGSGPTLDVYLEGKDQTSGKYKTIWHPTQFTAAGTQWFTITDLIFRYVRLRWVVGGTSPSFTFSCGMEMKR